MVVIITIDTGFREWESVFYDDKLTSAIIERLVHYCHLISRIEVADLKIGDSSLEAKQLIPGSGFLFGRILYSYCHRQIEQ